MEIILKEFKHDHLEWFLEIRNHISTRSQLKNNSIFTIEQAIEWYQKLDSPWYVIENQESDLVGYIRTNGYEIGCDIHPDFRCEADIEEWGFKFHMNDVCAAIGMENFKHMDRLVSKHKENAAYYDLRLQNVNGVTLLKREEGFESAFWIYTLKVDDRPSFYEYMKECNITVSQVHERNDKHCLSSKQSYQT